MKTTNFLLLIVALFYSIWLRLLDRRIFEISFSKTPTGYHLKCYGIYNNLLSTHKIHSKL